MDANLDTLEVIDEARDLSAVLSSVETLIEEFKEELVILHDKRDLITKQRDEDSRLVSANQMWKARSSYKYEHKNDLEIRTNHIEALKDRAKRTISEAEALKQLDSTDTESASCLEQKGDSEENKMLNLESRTCDLQKLYFAVNDIFNKLGSLLEEILVEIEDYIQNAAIYEQAKHKLETKLKALEIEYYPPGDAPMSTTSESAGGSHKNSVASTESGSNSGRGASATQSRLQGWPSSTGAMFVLHSSESQPNGLPLLKTLSVEELESERVKIRNVIANIFDQDAHTQLEELKLILEEVVLSSDAVRDEIQLLIDNFQKEEAAAFSRQLQIETVLDFKMLDRTLELSVKLPWRRVISPESGLPIYMKEDSNHVQQMSLEHPKFTKIRTRLLNSSAEVKHTNYRVGKKATYLQYMLLGGFWTSWHSFVPSHLKLQDLPLSDYLPFIRQLYESIDEEVASRGRLAESMDCFFNLLIQIAGADTLLNGQTAQTVVVILCSASFQEKLYSLFQLFETNSSYDALHQEPMILTKDFRILLQNLLTFTRFLDEESYEEMRQCLFWEMEKVKDVWITQTQFFDWVDQRPLIIDWMRCHEEFVRSKPSEVRHQAKCDQCLVYPIEGILFSCQKCPDFHLCDTCYLAKAFHHKHSHLFQSITEPLAKRNIQESLFRKLSGKKHKKESVSRETWSFEERRSSSLKRPSCYKKSREQKQSLSFGVAETDQKRSQERLPVKRAAQSQTCESFYHSLKTTTASQSTPNSRNYETSNGDAVYTYVDYYDEPSFDPTSLRANETSATIKQGTRVVATIPAGDEHLSIMQLVGALKPRMHPINLPAKCDQGRIEEGVARDEQQTKVLNEKVIELEDMFSNLFSHVKSISKTAGITLSSDGEKTATEHEELHYDSIMSLKFAREIEQIVVHVNESLTQVHSNKELRAHCTVIGSEVCLYYPIKTSVVQLSRNGDRNASLKHLSLSTEGVYEEQIAVELESDAVLLCGGESKKTTCDNVDVDSNSAIDESRKLPSTTIEKYCADLIEQCFNDVNIKLVQV